MELELKKQELTCCEMTERMIVSHEETMEAAIPEYCPDIARIVDAVGQLKIREKKLSDGRLTVGGTVRVTVLYTSEESTGLRSLLLSVPFTCVIDDQRLQGCRSICANGRLLLVEARTITARKLYVRVMPEFELEGIRSTEYEFCCSAESESAIRQRCSEKEVQLLTGVLERSFPFHQEYLPEPGRGVPEDLLFDRAAVRLTGCQRIGSKLMVKGEACMTLLYRTEEQDLSSCEAVLVFSQILEGAELPDQAEYQAEVWVEDSDVRLTHLDGGVGFGISIRIGVMVKIYEQKNLCYIEDMYSLTHKMTLHRQHQSLLLLQPPRQHQQEYTELLEFGQGRPFACATAVECGAVSVTPQGEGAVLRSGVRMKILYLDESGTPVSTERMIETETTVSEVPENVRVTCGAARLRIGANNAELYLPLSYTMQTREEFSANMINSAEIQEPDQEERPSFVLRRVQEGETLWELAKCYRTTTQAIEDANDLEGKKVLPQGMLLIPKAKG